MRNRFMFLGLSLSIVTGAGVFACSGSTESTNTVTDAGSDAVADTGPKDTGVDAFDSATCDLSADFVTKIPDASIADGASTTGICAACVEANCKSQVDKCNHNCECQGVADQALQCFAKAGGSITALAACAGDFGNVSTSTQSILISLGSCVNSSCETECATKSFIQDAGSDG